MKYLNGVINRPPICGKCGEKMVCEVQSAEQDLEETSWTQQIGWHCKVCYEPFVRYG